MAKAKTKLKNAPKSNDPLDEKPLPAEVQRISRIFKNRINQMEIAATLPAILRVNSLSSIKDEELKEALERHRLLAERFDADTQDRLEKEAGGEDGEARKKATTQLEDEIKSSIRHVLRLLRAHPDAFSDLKAEQSVEIGASERKLIEALKMFHSQMVDKMQTSVDEEKQQLLYKSTSPHAHALMHLAPVQEKVAADIKSVDAKICQVNEEIGHLQESLDNTIAATRNLRLPHIEYKCEPQITERQIRKQQEIKRKENELYNLRRENKEKENVIQNEIDNLGEEFENLVKKFDSEMEGLQAKMELKETERKKVEEELRKLEEPFSVLEKDYNEIRERRRLAEEKRQEEMRELELKTRAAILAQAWWRGYSTRRALKNKGKNKKAKKGKGKKK